MKKLIWEDVEHGMSRTPVPMGWLVMVQNDVLSTDPDRRGECGWEWRPALTFVPDPNHEWGKEDDVGRQSQEEYEAQVQDLTDHFSQYADHQGVPETLERVARLAVGYGMRPDLAKEIMERQIPGIG